VLSKYTALYLLVLVPLLAAPCALVAGVRFSNVIRRRVLGALGLVGLYVLGVGLLVNAAFCFEGTFKPAAAIPLTSGLLGDLASWRLPLGLPEAYLRGLDFAAGFNERLPFGPNYVLGRLDRTGTWYGFSVMLLLKTPLAFFPLLVISLVGSLRARATPLWRFWLLPAFVHLAVFSLCVRAQVGVRYVLPSVVLGILAAAAAARLRGRIALFGVVALSGWYVGSSLSYLPHPMSYLNEIVGRRIHSYRWLADSNLDWEDRRTDIARYKARHPELEIAVEPAEVRPGHILVGVNRLLAIVGKDIYWPLRRLEPIDHVGYSFLLYHVTAEDLEAAERRRRRRTRRRPSPVRAGS
jgi:hypothetical protein